MKSLAAIGGSDLQRNLMCGDAESSTPLDRGSEARDLDHFATDQISESADVDG